MIQQPSLLFLVRPYTPNFPSWWDERQYKLDQEMLENVSKTPRSFAADRPLSQQESHSITILHNHLNSRPTIWDAQ